MEVLLNADKDLKKKLAETPTIVLNYTMRLKKKEEWVVQMISDGETHAIAHKPMELPLWAVRKMLDEEANALKAYLRRRIPAFKVAIFGYYFYGAKKMQYFGRL